MIKLENYLYGVGVVFNLTSTELKNGQSTRGLGIKECRKVLYY